MKKLNIFIIIFIFVISLLSYPFLPESIPMHWNIRGEIDNFMPKFPAVFLIPILTLGIHLLYYILPSFDPLKKKYKLFKREWGIIQTGIIGFLGYMQFIILYASLNPLTNITPLVFIGLGALLILIGNYLSKIRQNYFVGIKLPWTLASEDNWNKTHRYASWCFVMAGILTLAEAYFFWFAPVVIFGSIILATILPIIYSFLLFKKQEHKMKYVYGVLIFLALAIFILRLVSGEDDWMCVNGQWVKHGAPNAPKPTTPCR